MSDDDNVMQRVFFYTTDGQEWTATASVFEMLGLLEAYRDENYATLHITQYDPMQDWYLNKVNITNIKVLNLEDIKKVDRSGQPPAKSRRSNNAK